jgi:hypothetical protein
MLGGDEEAGAVPEVYPAFFTAKDGFKYTVVKEVVGGKLIYRAGIDAASERPPIALRKALRKKSSGLISFKVRTKDSREKRERTGRPSWKDAGRQHSKNPIVMENRKISQRVPAPTIAARKAARAANIKASRLNIAVATAATATASAAIRFVEVLPIIATLHDSHY